MVYATHDSGVHTAPAHSLIAHCDLSRRSSVHTSADSHTRSHTHIRSSDSPLMVSRTPAATAMLPIGGGGFTRVQHATRTTSLWSDKVVRRRHPPPLTLACNKYTSCACESGSDVLCWTCTLEQRGTLRCSRLDTILLVLSPRTLLSIPHQGSLYLARALVRMRMA